jgi:hypothetical protein
MIRRLCAAAALVTAVALPAAAEGFEGVSWSRPSLMVTADHWSTSCPARCVVYQGDEDRDQESWPLVVVHAPVTGAASAFYSKWASAIERADDETVSPIGNQSSALDTGATLHIYISYTEAEGVTSGRDTSMLFLHEKDGVIVPVEIKSFYKDELGERMDEATAILESLRLDAVMARAAR